MAKVKEFKKRQWPTSSGRPGKMIFPSPTYFP